MKLKKTILFLNVPTLIMSVALILQSCNSDNYGSAASSSMNNSSELVINSIVESDEFLDFEMNSKLVSEKVQAYISKLSKEEFDELMYYRNDDDYMDDFVNKAGISNEILLVAKSRDALLNNTDFLKLNNTEQTQLFLEFHEKDMRMLIKTRTEGGTGECDRRRQSDYSWARAVADIGLIGCTCALEVPVVACACYALVMANYANDIRLADRAYRDCVGH